MKIEEKGRIDVDSLPIPKWERHGVLAIAIKDIISRFEDQSFTILHILYVLNALNVKISQKTPKIRIHKILDRFVDSDFITVVRGKGSGPNVYTSFKKERVSAGENIE